MTSKGEQELLEPFRKPVLEIIHKSSESVKKLVEKANFLINEKFYPGEIVELPILRKGKKVTGEIVECGEFNKENNITGEAFYNILLSEEKKLISCVPGKDIRRIESPSNECLEYFILSHANKASSNSQWVVRPELVNQYSLGPKLADIFIKKAVKIKEKKAESTNQVGDTKHIAKSGKNQKRYSIEKQSPSEDHSYSTSATVKKAKLTDNSRGSDHSYSSLSAETESDDCILIEETVRGNGEDHSYSSKESESDKLPDACKNDFSRNESSVSVVKSFDKSDHNYSSSASDDLTDLTEHNYCSPVVSGSDDSPIADHSYSSENKLANKKKIPSKKMKITKDGKSKLRDKKIVKKDGVKINKNKRLADSKGRSSAKALSSDNYTKALKIKGVSVKLLSMNGSPVNPTSKLKQRTLFDFAKQKPDQSPINCNAYQTESCSIKLNEKTSTPKPSKNSVSLRRNSKNVKSKLGKSKSQKQKLGTPVPCSRVGSPKSAESATHSDSPMSSLKKRLLMTPKVSLSPLKKYMESQTPACVRSLQLHLKEGKTSKINRSLKVCALILQDYQIEKLSSEIKDMIKNYKKKIETAQYLKSLTPEQLVEYKKEKKKENTEKRKLLKLANRGQPENLQEDSLIPNLTPLPEPELVDTPDGLPNECFGNISMIVEFCNAYHSLLFPKEPFMVTLDDLMSALCGGEAGYLYMNKLMVSLLNLILKEENIEMWKDASVNVLTASEFTRLVFSTSECTLESTELDDILNQLDTCDLYELTPSRQVILLSALVNRVLQSDSLQLYVEEMGETVHQLWKEKIEKDKEKKLKEKNLSPNASGETGQNKGGTLLDYYRPGDTQPLGKSLNSSTDENPEESSDILKTIRMRRVRLEESKKLKGQLEKERREKKQKEIEQMKHELAEERFVKKFDDNISLHRRMKRVAPLGTDRHHNRYWIFPFKSSILYVEKGWSSQFFDNCITLTDAEESEETFPPISQNLWFCYTKSEDIQSLCQSLNDKGVRESALKAKLKKNLTQLIQTDNCDSKSYDPLDKGFKMSETFKKELSDLNDELLSGSLGGLDLERKLQEGSDPSSFSDLLLDCFNSIQDKFLKQEVDRCKESNTTLTCWNKAVQEASTWSKLHLCLSYLESHVKWERSLANKKCRVCRKKETSSGQTVLCEQCAQAFHIYCLRPPLSSLPNEAWSCAHCRPTLVNARSRRKQQESLEEEDEDENRVEVCFKCHKGGELVFCSKCGLGFHNKCARIPAFTRTLRNWECLSCQERPSGGMKKKTLSKRNLRSRSAHLSVKSPYRQAPSDASETYDPSDENSSEDSEVSVDES